MHRRPSTLRRRAALALPALALLTAACGSGGDEQAADPASGEATSAAPSPTGGATEEPPATRTPASPEESTDPADAGPPFPDGTDLQTAAPDDGSLLVLTGVRAAAHDGFDRVVLDFEGEGVPGWSIGYVDEPVADGSGEPVDVAGRTFLDVYANGTTYPADGVYDGPSSVRVDGGTVVEAAVVGTFEGFTQVVLGLDGDRTPFRVFPLADPPRLVVDVVD